MGSSFEYLSDHLQRFCCAFPARPREVCFGRNFALRRASAPFVYFAKACSGQVPVLSIPAESPIGLPID